MSPIFAISSALLSPAGNTQEQHIAALRQQQPAVQAFSDAAVAPAPFFAGRLPPAMLQVLAARYPGAKLAFSPFEQMCLFAIEEALQETVIDCRSEDCILILSTTKGNIEWLNRQPDERISLHRSATLIAEHLGLAHRPIVVANACISGALALLTGMRLLEAGRYRHAIVVGCDRFSSFVHSGFQSFHALAEGLCRPFDRDRKGINLGEAAACMVLSVAPAAGAAPPLARLAGGGASNDANHLSGPSRTGEELAAAIGQAMRQASVRPGHIGAISAHGTATMFNDEMEAKALTLAGLAHVPLHSFKSYVGHTLGAAGILESAIACMAMQQDLLPASLNYAEPGVSTPVNVQRQAEQGRYDYVLKTASGFGGCNAALVWEKFN
ncbi:beta-ketoacyl-[acyl-carrier-protein] synthase family protein [Taibaiella helva]|uniref:beta-ketoacyl-[acyl-carrier-protein] synthase family protein n=1 Tax=Taibaiella helva TaxID=2301235 RepID=UPI0018E4E6E7|nr:beta-ketoacyl synthase N-terminal-like domain-containing protein [Taibaiella helva]